MDFFFFLNIDSIKRSSFEWHGAEFCSLVKDRDDQDAHLESNA